MSNEILGLIDGSTFMKHVKDEKGFTMVEVLIALAILVIIIAAFTALFTTGARGIFSAGRKSNALFEAQNEMDNFIAEGNSDGLATHNIEFDSITITVTGEEKIISTEYEGRTVEIYYFLPGGN